MFEILAFEIGWNANFDVDIDVVGEKPTADVNCEARRRTTYALRIHFMAWLRMKRQGFKLDDHC